MNNHCYLITYIVQKKGEITYFNEILKDCDLMTYANYCDYYYKLKESYKDPEISIIITNIHKFETKL